MLLVSYRAASSNKAAVGADKAKVGSVCVLTVRPQRSERRYFPNRPIATGAAKVPEEPDSAILVSCCARTQREECGGCEKFDSTWQRAMRPFMHVAA
jgi:hypothetical protein